MPEGVRQNVERFARRRKEHVERRGAFRVPGFDPLDVVSSIDPTPPASAGERDQQGDGVQTHRCQEHDESHVGGGESSNAIGDEREGDRLEGEQPAALRPKIGVLFRLVRRLRQGIGRIRGYSCGRDNSIEKGGHWIPCRRRGGPKARGTSDETRSARISADSLRVFTIALNSFSEEDASRCWSTRPYSRGAEWTLSTLSSGEQSSQKWARFVVRIRGQPNDICDAVVTRARSSAAGPRSRPFRFAQCSRFPG